MIRLKTLCISLIISAVCTNIQAQGGWEITYPSPTAPNGDGIDAVRQTPDGGYILAGLAEHNSSASQARVMKVDVHGVPQWAQTYSVGSYSWATNVEVHPMGGYVVEGRYFNDIDWRYETFLMRLDNFGNQTWLQTFSEANVACKGFLTADGGYVAVNYFDNNSIQDTIVVIKTNASGNTDWVKKYPNVGTGIERLPHSIIQTANNEYVIEGYKDIGFGGNTFLWRLDSNGDSLWQQTYGTQTSQPEYIGKVIEKAGGNLVVVGNDALTFGANDVHLFETTANGNLLWQQHFDNTGLTDYGCDVDIAADGGYIVTGYTNSTNARLLLLKTDASGVLEWKKVFDGDGQGGYTWKGYSVRTTADGGFIVGGAKLSGPYSRENMYLIKTDSLGEIYTNIIKGYVYHDADADCNTGITEHRFEGWVVQAQGTQTFTTTTDSDGYYEMRVDTGNYTLTLLLPPLSNYWATVCGNDTVLLSIPNQLTLIDTSFAQEALVDCSLLWVEMSAPLLRRCFISNYYVSYSNNGTIAENAPYIDITFDDFLMVDTAALTVPFAQLDTVTYRFPLDTLEVGEQGSFVVPVYVSCDAVLGQTHCSQAHIYPDTVCYPAIWAGAVIEVEGECLGDSVVFTLSNSGAMMQMPLQYVVYEDNVLIRPGTFSLLDGENTNVTVQANNGATYRIEAQQEQGFPALLGDPLVALAVEGCSGGINTGFVTQLSNYDLAAAVDIDCQQNIGAYDPNDKRGFPEGYGTEHYIYDNTRLDYHIRFQNTGTDTAFNVVIRDTLSPFLDISTLQVGTASHAFKYSIYGQNQQAIAFIFDNIALPDSHVNEPASHGFIQFSIQQKLQNPIGTIIENQAAIYFDFNEPVFTNTTFHEVNEDFIIENISAIPNVAGNPSAQLRIYPVPMTNTATIEVLAPNVQSFTLSLYDVLGRQVHQINASGGSCTLERGALIPGVYFYKVETNTGLTNSGSFSIR